MSKKILALTLALAMCLGLISCGGGGSGAKAATSSRWSLNPLTQKQMGCHLPGRKATQPPLSSILEIRQAESRRQSAGFLSSMRQTAWFR